MIRTPPPAIRPPALDDGVPARPDARRDPSPGRRAVLGWLGAAAVALPAALRGPGAAAEPTAGVVAGRDRPFRILMILWRGWTDAEQGFKDYLAAARIPVILMVRDVAGDRTRLPAVVEEARRERPDLVYAWGTTVSLDTLGTVDAADPERHITDIPALFALVAAPVESRLVPDLGSSRRNIAGATFVAPLKAQINAMRSFRPVRRLAVIYTAAESSSRAVVAGLESLAAAERFTVIARPVPERADGTPDPGALPDLVRDARSERADFLYLPPDSFLSVHGRAVTRAAVDRRLPTFAAAEGVLSGTDALFGLVARYYGVGKMNGLLARRILVDGEQPHTLPIASLTRYSLVLNMRVVRELGLYPPMRLLRIAEVSER